MCLDDVMGCLAAAVIVGVLLSCYGVVEMVRKNKAQREFARELDELHAIVSAPVEGNG